VIVIAAGAVARAQGLCVGDCPPPDQQVTVSELIVGVNIALGTAALGDCPSDDVDGSGHVGIDALITAVNNALSGCPGGPTPLPSPTPTGVGPTVPPTTTALPTATATIGPGPVVSFFGVANANDSLPQPTVPGAIPVYQRSFGSGFQLVVEAVPGNQGAAIFDAKIGGGQTYTFPDPPDLQIQATRDLGNGSSAVCDNSPGNFGGVPGIDPPELGDPGAIANALNDFGCRFITGTGATASRPCSESCVYPFADEVHQCVGSQTARQFCAEIDPPLEFPAGDTLVTVRVRDVAGNLGAPAQLIVRVASP
jgi:hypothetical protein